MDSVVDLNYYPIGCVVNFVEAAGTSQTDVNWIRLVGSSRYLEGSREGERLRYSEDLHE